MTAAADRSPRRAAPDDGIAVILVALMLMPLVLFAAIGVDVASWHARVSELQATADAAATAGSVWMPNLVKATSVANENLAMNGVVDGVDDMQVEIAEGATATSLRVVVTDAQAERYLSKMVEGEQVLTRSAEAEYFLPLPLGSPLNYFGGDASKTANTLTWPMPYDWTGRGLVGPFPCNVGTASTQGVGRWTSATAYNTGFTTGGVQCQWTAVTATTSVGAAVQHPTNVPCNVQQAVIGGLGRWSTAAADTVAPTYAASSRHVSGTGNRQCTWVRPDTEPASFATWPPTNAPCNVTGELADGAWAAGVHSPGTAHRDGNVGQRLCQWVADVTVATNPIAPTRNPRFWAQIHGPGGNQQSGDAYSTKCRVTLNCAVPDNPLYVAPTDPNQGYWYAVRAPAGGGGPTTIRIFDASLTPGVISSGTGDSVITNANMSFATSYRVYEQTNPVDFNSRSPVTAGAADANEGSCSWNLRSEVTFRLQWADLCTIDMDPGDTYLINVRSAAISGVTNSDGRNSYAIEAVTNGGAGPQPALFAYNRMVMYNNVSAGAATFYVAEVSPAYAGKTLVLELYDPGESAGDAWLYPMMPSAAQTGATVSPPTSSCSFSSTRAGYPRAEDRNLGGVCSVRTSANGALFNGEWVTVRVTIPEDYTCTAGRNPETEAGSCWWGIRYAFGGAATDTTTWQARVEGNPVHLTR